MNVRVAWLCALQLMAACALEAPLNAPRLDAGVHKPAGSAAMPAPPPDAGGDVSTTPVVGLNPEVILASGCATSTEQSSLLPANLLFVVDRSGSMNCNPPPVTPSDVCLMNEARVDINMPSKWDLTSRAILFALGTLPDTTFVGLSYFSNNNVCGVSRLPYVPLARNSMGQRSIITTSLLSIKPSGSTPLVGATVLAYEYLHQSALNGDIAGNRYVVLITDGQQSDQCGDPMRCTTADACTDLLLQETAQAAGPGVNIRTFVIGVPGSERARTVLSQIAKAGGTAAPDCTIEAGNCHFDVTQEQDLSMGLQRALQKIAGETLSCELDLPRPEGGVVDLSLVNVVFAPHEGRARIIPQDMHAACDSGQADGWQYDPSQQQIRLCGRTCSTVRNDRGGRIDVVLGCPVVGPI